MPTSLGAHNARIDAARDLLTKKGRKQQARFSFEGATLLQEARGAGVPIDALYVTKDAYGRTPVVAQCEREGVPVYLVDERAMRRISDVETPTGVLAVAPLRFSSPQQILQDDGVVLLLADLNDPGNTGTLLRTAEAFGVRGVILGSHGAEPHLPKVVRSAMGALFRLPLAVADPQALGGSLESWEVTGLAADAEPLHALAWGPRSILAVGNERHGLGRWEALCTRRAAIPMSGSAESLNAAVAGGIALYEATKRRPV
ncbi:MAG TPA: RNA methyltransferase [Candidatus Baltobacteraceae bacterium]|nr:RNA methyltransferase [Candidatus Baltobacteraceae bacterium]